MATSLLPTPVRWSLMMRTPIQFIALLLVLSACLTSATAQSLAKSAQSPSPTRVAAPTAPKNEDARFQRFAHSALEDHWRQFPEWAFDVGRYDYADQMTVPNQVYRARTVAFYERQLAALATFDQRKLSASSRVDHALLRNEFESSRWGLTTFKDWEWQPSTYNVGGSFGRMLTGSYAPLDTRLRHVLARLAHVPAYYEAARASVANPSLEHTQLAILQNKGALDVFGDDLVQSVAASGLSVTEKTQFVASLASAKAAITAYIDWLSAMEPGLKTDGARSFRIGRDLYAQKFAYDIQSGWSAEQLYQRAKAEKTTLHDQMEKLARDLWPKVMGQTPVPTDRLDMIRAVIEELSKKHATAETFVEAVRKQIPELEAFVRTHDLLTQDPTRPLVVRETPPYKRGEAVARINAPGPYDPTAKTYYSVDPIDDSNPEKAESFLREYNDWMLQIVNIHEAVPGHYTQLIHANKSKSAIKSIFGNGSMQEGWAVYGEKMMLDAGYGNHAPELHLIWMKFNLRSVANAILDYEIHTQGLERDAGIAMLTHEAFQQQSEAVGKWRRATLTQVQLTSYFNGYAEITALRDEHKARLGKDFSVKKFNNRFLSYGSAPVKLIRELM
jgi:uncharacterized protein (DUF885 family)